jgi:NADH-quinone oxidoreductase subunit E
MNGVGTAVRKIADRHGRDRDKLLPVLQDIVESENFLSEDAMKAVAREFDLSAAEVYGVATFYSFIDVSRLGKNVIRVCKTISCDIKGKQAVLDAIGRRLRVSAGETTPDQKFTFLTTNCIGWCHESPAMLINNTVYSGLTPESAVAALEEWM